MFRDRVDAGRKLAKHLEHLRDEDPIVLGLPRGGVPVAFEISETLDAPLDVIVVRKLGAPYQPELAMGALGEGGVLVIDEAVMSICGVTAEQLEELGEQAREQVERRTKFLRRLHPRVPLAGRVVIIVDDGIATGSTMRAAARVARAQGAARVVVAAPVAPMGVKDRLADDADEVIVVETPEPFFAIGEFYRDFTQISEDEVAECLQRATGGSKQATPPGS